MHFCQQKKIYFIIINIFYHDIVNFQVHIQNEKNSPLIMKDSYFYEDSLERKLYDLQLLWHNLLSPNLKKSMWTNYGQFAKFWLTMFWVRLMHVMNKLRV
jgi:hypothetical protein